jgi:hypothetical protein
VDREAAGDQQGDFHRYACWNAELAGKYQQGNDEDSVLKDEMFDCGTLLSP